MSPFQLLCFKVQTPDSNSTWHDCGGSRIINTSVAFPSCGGVMAGSLLASWVGG